MGSPASPAVPEVTVRQTDLDRIERLAGDTQTHVFNLSGKVGEIRVLLAEGYVSKRDHHDEIVELRRDTEIKIAANREASKTESELFRADFKQHSDSDDQRFAELRRLLYGLIAGVIILGGGVIVQLILTVIGMSIKSPHVG